MALYIPSDNKLVVCPYDEAHKMKESRLQLHIAKCKLNHLDLAKKICPFNASHLLLQGEYDHHLINCPDRGSLDRQLAQAVNKNNPYKGRTDVPTYSEPVIDDESWDDITTTLTLAPPPTGAIIEPPAMAKPAERRKLYKELHQAPKTENDKAPLTSVKQAAPRQPKQPSETQMFQNTQQPNPQVIQSLGLGRGKPASRIAANFPAAQNEDARYSSIVKNMSNLGLGRGNPVRKDPPPPIYDPDDFPALGCGRGAAALAPKQNLRTPGSKPEK